MGAGSVTFLLHFVFFIPSVLLHGKAKKTRVCENAALGSKSAVTG